MTNTFDPWQTIVNVGWTPTGGGSGSLDSDGSNPPAMGSWGPMAHMGSSSTGGATNDGAGKVTLPNTGTYLISLAASGGVGDSGSLQVGMQSNIGGMLAESPEQEGASGTQNIAYSTTVAAPGVPPGEETPPPTFTVETVFKISGSPTDAVVILSILGTITKVS